MRNWLYLASAGVLGAAAVALPAVAGSEPAPTIDAVNVGASEHRWSPASASVAAGASVSIANPTSVSHGVQWVSTPAGPPACSGVPGAGGGASAEAHWGGSCTFSTPGTYVFYCTVHGAEMTGTITVTSGGGGETTPTSTTPTSTSTTPSSTPPQSPAAGGGYQAGTGSQGGTAGSPSPAPVALLAGPATAAIRVAAVQRGGVARGTVAVSPEGAGGRLQVTLLAARAALSSGHERGTLAVGATARTVRAAGRVPFAVALDARARRALARDGRLRLTMRITLRSAAGASLSVTRAVLMRR